MRIAALGDLHGPRLRPGELMRRLAGVEEQADVLLLCGDLTDDGAPHQARAVMHELMAVKIPIVAVLGNHDYEAGEVETVRRILAEARVQVLDGDAVVIGQLGIAGTKGFGGGFGKRRVIGFGEPATKQFVAAGRREAEKLAQALASLDTLHRVAITHYAPTMSTTIGEAPEILPFLGNSDLAEAAETAGADAMFHGHCHFGKLQGHTDHGIPVYNCALPVLDHQRPPRRYVVVELG
jgi:Icc-related predicted phosphoesterase